MTRLVPGTRTMTFCEMLDPFQEEFNAFMLGEKLGAGETRTVYAVPADPKRWVFKIEDIAHRRQFHNVREWNAWNELEHYPEARAWLAPCRFISSGGRILVMARTKPLKSERELRGIKLPDFLEDTHWGNLGHYKGRLVCHDYAFNRFAEKAARRFRLVTNKAVSAVTTPT